MLSNDIFARIQVSSKTFTKAEHITNKIRMNY